MHPPTGAAAAADGAITAWSRATAAVGKARDRERSAHEDLERQLDAHTTSWTAIAEGHFVTVSLGGPEEPGQPGGAKYVLGPPTRPPLTFDDDFLPDPGTTPTVADRLSWAEWGVTMEAARVARPDLDDALALYAHYRDGSGTPTHSESG
ncbi:hypothetical protein [Pseudonocardia nigra]|uniref:hypothetical protein n=1 Tax=Pseudonocardia nigra TaxID=1921578 RepID=UPI001C5E7366|nr:hypothetical protein [Pseudonocardia nigra]